MNWRKLLNWKKLKGTENKYSDIATDSEVIEDLEKETESISKIIEVEPVEEVIEKPAKIEEEDPFKAVHELFETATINAMLQMPMWMRLNYFVNTFEKGGDDTNINWDKVNNFLMLGIDKKKPYYNICGKIKNLNQLRKAAVDAQIAFIPEFNMPFYRRKCKQCGDKFTLTIGEIQSYEKKGLNIPCRCYHCRKGINKHINEHIVSTQKEDNVKTEMQLALEKAGII